MFSLSSKWRRHQVRPILLADTKFNTIFQISIINYFSVPNLSFILHFVTKILAILCFHCNQKTTSSNSIDFLKLIRTSLPSMKSATQATPTLHTKFEFHASFRYQDIGSFTFSLSSKWLCHWTQLILSVDSNLNTIIEISIIKLPLNC